MFQGVARFARRCSGWGSRTSAASAVTRSLLALACAALPTAANAEPTAADAEPTAASAEPAAPPTEAAPAPDPEGGLIALARDLELTVTETGPDQPWTLHLSNRGEAPLGLMADPGLLWFEVTVPGATSPHVCRLPEPLWPKSMRRRAERILGPGERFSRRFDPRFFCFHDLVQTTLVPNARVVPHFGWPVETRTVRVKGKRVTEPMPSRLPFVAWVPSLPAEPAEPAADSDVSPPDETPPEAPWQPPSEGIKNVVGGAIVLSPSYGKWSERVPAPTDGLQLALLAGSDAEDERAAVVTLGVGNAGSDPQTVVLRRDLIAFDVNGPDGSFECPAAEIGPPDIASFTTLESRASERFVVRLIEMCPRGGFSRPGLYEVRASWHASFSGQSLGIDAFVGTVNSPRPALVRVRSGERASFVRAAAPMVATGGVAPPATSADDAPPDDGAADPQPSDDAPDDHEVLPADDVPMPDAPVPDGTLVE